MAKTISELRNQSIQVRDASVAGENTATRVGTVLNDIVGHIEDYENTQSSNNSSQDAKIEGVKSSLNAEIARAKTEESNLSTQIVTERTERQTAVSREETARIQADNDEKTARQQADNAEQDARIKADNDEKTARENADITLRTMIQTETSDRKTAIQQETARAKAAEEANATAIENVANELSDHKDLSDTRYEHVNDEINRLDNADEVNAKAIADETARAKAAEEANAAAIVAEEEARSLVISQEAQARTQNDENLNNAIVAETSRAKAAEEANTNAIAKRGIYDVSAYNDGAVFESLSALLNNANLSTLIPASVRCGGMSIRFIQGSVLNSDNKYVQYRLMSDSFNTTEANWQEAADKEALSLLSTLIIGEYNLTEPGTKNTSGDSVITTPENYAARQKTINVQGGEQFVIFGFGAIEYRLWAFVDDNDNILLKSNEHEDIREKGAMIIAPENATKLIISSYTNHIADFALFGKGVITKLFDIVEPLEGDVETLYYKVNGEARQISTDSKFLAKYNTSGNVVIETSPNDNVWQLIIDVQPLQIATIFGYGPETYRLWAFVNDEGNIISKCDGSVNATTTPQVVEVPQGATKLYVSCYGTYISTFNISITTKSLENIILGQINILEGKKLYFIGDSIMIGQPNVPDIGNITIHISNDYNCQCENNARGGSLFVYPWYQTNQNSIYYQLTQIPNDADYIIIQGGVNGVNMTNSTQPNYAPMGEISPNFDIIFDKTTQIGCLEAICQYLHEHFAGKKVGFIMTYQIGSYQYWKDKAILFERVLHKWSIPILDWRESGISLASPNLASKWGIDTFANYDNYDTEASYSIDDRVIYDNKCYKAEENIASPAGAFDVSKWTLISSQRYDSWHCNGLAYKMLAHKTAEWIKTL